jgi:outer membrane protein assembly factor BamB
MWMLPLKGVLSAPPHVADGRAYLPVEGERLVAVDTLSGLELWTAPVGTRLEPAAGDGLVFVAGAEELLALRDTDGSPVWRLSLQEPLATPPVWANGWLVTTVKSGTVTAYRGSDGSQVWQHDTGSSARARPTLAADRLYVPTEDGRLTALLVETGETVWERQFDGMPSEVLAAEPRLYVGSTDNFFYCLNAASGQVIWRWRTGGDIVGLPAADDQKVYFVSLDNVLRALDRSNGAERWHQGLPLRPDAGPVLAADVVLVSGIAPTVYSFLRENGASAGTIGEKTGELAAPPRVVPGPVLPAVLVASRDIAKGVQVRAFVRRVDPAAETIRPLPNAVPVGKTSPDVPPEPAPTKPVR